MKKQESIVLKRLNPLRVKEVVILEGLCKNNGGLVMTIRDNFKKNILEKGKMEVIY